MKKLFTLGLVLQVLAQISFSLHSQNFNLLRPIDFIHWTILISVVLLIPYTLTFSKGLYHTIGATITIIGITAHIGMCAIDLVLWSFKEDWDGRKALVQQLINEPSIWPIFITVGPAFLIVGLAFQALGFWNDKRNATIVTIIGALLIGMGDFIIPGYRVVFLVGYAIFAAGLVWIALEEN